MSISPNVRRRQQAMARWVKRSPGYQFMLTEVLPRVRRNAVLSDLAWRVFGAKHGAGQVDVPLHPGRHLAGKDARMLPVIGFLGVARSPGASAPALDHLIEQVAALQQRHRSFRPVLIVDRPVFAHARTHGFVVELVLAQDGFVGQVAGAGDQGWVDYLAERVGSIVDHYQLWHLVRADDYRLDDLDLALLAQLSHRLPAELDVTATRDEA